MNKFDKDSRRLQEFAGRPFADKIYHQHLNPTKIFRPTAFGGNAILDQQYAIDCLLTLPEEFQWSIQEKFLSYDKQQFNSVTIEYYQNPATLELGDWQKCIAQFIFVAYLNEDNTGFCKYSLINKGKLDEALLNKQVQWEERQNQNGSARASFRYMRVEKIPKECIVFQDGFISMKKQEWISDSLWENKDAA